MYYDEFEFDTEQTILAFRRSAKFKGGGGGDPPSSELADTETKKFVRRTLYPMAQRGLEGKGFGSNYLDSKKRLTLYGGASDAYNTAASDLRSQMRRTVDPADNRVKSFAENSLARAYTTKRDDISRSLRSERTADVDLAMNMASDYLGGERRMTAQAGQAYNQAMQTNLAEQQRVGSYSSNIAAGIGSTFGGLIGAHQIDQKYAQKWT